VITSVARPQAYGTGDNHLVRDWEPTSSPRGGVLIVHGLNEHSGRYERTGGLLAESGLRVRSFDLLGFGASSGLRSYIDHWGLYLDQVAYLMASIREWGLPVVLLGHSMGGLIALDYALSDRPQSDVLILSAPALGGGKGWQRAVAPLFGRLLPTAGIAAGIRGDQLSRDPEVGKAYFADPLVLTKTSGRLGAEIFATQDRVLSHLEDLKLPTLVIHGGLDTLVPPQSSLPLQAGLTVERTLYPKLRHEMFNEPEGPEVVGDVIAWIDRHLTKSG
jgi:alpha-beta hydrolase superfamily lysophospholipase